jgi:hypothetical protein
LAAVTCKDNLRLAITNNLRTTLGGQQGTNLPPHIDQAIHTVVQDNIEVACAVVQVKKNFSISSLVTSFLSFIFLVIPTHHSFLFI